jgi:hypothetical protein
LLAVARSGAAAARNINIVETNAVIPFQSEVDYDAAYSTAITSQKKRGGTHGRAGRLQAVGCAEGFVSDVSVYDDTCSVFEGNLVDVGTTIAADNWAADAIAVEERPAGLERWVGGGGGGIGRQQFGKISYLGTCRRQASNMRKCTLITPGQSSTAAVGWCKWFEKNLLIQPPPPPMMMIGNWACRSGICGRMAAAKAAVVRK